MKIEFQDYYERLGVTREASADEIQRAYRKLARRYHPDVNKEPEAEQRFKSITEAYEVLKDPEKRRRYDELGENWDRISPEDFERYAAGAKQGRQSHRFSQFFRGGQGTGGGGGFSDFFEAFFGPGAQFTGSSYGADGPEWSMRGQDVEAELAVSLEESHHGGRRSFELSTGPQGRTQQYTVTIPKGVTDGNRIRLAGQGSPGLGQGEPGDLWLVVKLQKHPRFRPLKGHDLETHVSLQPWEAALGATVRVPTLSGSAELKVPTGVASGQKLRLRGQGLSKKSGGAGDLIVVLDIWLPKELGAKERELYEQLKEHSKALPPGRLS
ncbi:MAG: DnaJ C-terminal domain-containing protein [Planctomycetota bacterium]